MPQVTIHINARPYVVGCDDGEEARLMTLAADLDAKVRAADPGGGQLGETRLMLMGALIMADQAAGAAERATAAEAEAERLRAELARAEGRAVAALEAAALRIEAMASR